MHSILSPTMKEKKKKKKKKKKAQTKVKATVTISYACTTIQESPKPPTPQGRRGLWVSAGVGGPAARLRQVLDHVHPVPAPRPLFQVGPELVEHPPLLLL